MLDHDELFINNKKELWIERILWHAIYRVCTGWTAFRITISCSNPFSTWYTHKWSLRLLFNLSIFPLAWYVLGYGIKVPQHKVLHFFINFGVVVFSTSIWWNLLKHTVELKPGVWIDPSTPSDDCYSTFQFTNPFQRSVMGVHPGLPKT